MTCPFVVDDGAYVLGALAPAERAAFERHLTTCPACRDSVASLAVLPGLLGRLDTATATKTIPPVRVPETLLPRLLKEAARDRRRRRLRLVLAACVTAIVLAAGTVFAVFLRDRPAETVTQTPMVAVSEAIRVTAEVGLSAADTGTLIHMTCRYPGEPDGTWTLLLVVYSRSGDSEQAGSWIATEGQEIALTASTHFRPDEIAHVELQSVDHTTLLTWSP